MDLLGFIATPLGIVFITILLAVVFVMVRSVTSSARQQRIVYDTLLEAAKRRSLLRINALVSLRRKAETLHPLFEHLAAHGYPKLTLMVVIYQTAGSKAASELRRLAKEYGISVNVEMYKKGLDITARQAAQKSSDVCMVIDASDRFTPRFFEYVSFAFTQKDIAALRVRSVAQPDRTLGSGFSALTHVFKELYLGAFLKPAPLHKDVGSSPIVRTKVLARGSDPLVEGMLYDAFGRIQNATAYTAGWRSALTFATTALIVSGLVLVSPTDVLIYISLLITAVLLVIATIVIVQYQGLGVRHKLELIALTPLSPILWSIAIVRYAVIQLWLAASRLVRPRVKRTVRQAPQVRTQK